MRGRFVEVKGKVVKDDIVRRIQWCSHLKAFEIACDAITFAHNPAFQTFHNLLTREISIGIPLKYILCTPFYMLLQLLWRYYIHIRKHCSARNGVNDSSCSLKG